VFYLLLILAVSAASGSQEGSQVGFQEGSLAGLGQSLEGYEASILSGIAYSFFPPEGGLWGLIRSTVVSNFAQAVVESILGDIGYWTIWNVIFGIVILMI